MQMVACPQRLCVCCSLRRKVKTHSAYIKENNDKLSATQPTKAAINITKTPTNSLTSTHRPTTKARGSHKSSSAVRRITSLACACRPQRPAEVKSVQRQCNYSQAQLTSVAAYACSWNYSHSSGINARAQLATNRCTLHLISHVFVVVGALLTVLPQRSCAGCCSSCVSVAETSSTSKAQTILKRTRTHSPTANSLRLAAGKSHWPQVLHTPTTMGSCLGRCVSRDANGGGVASTATSCLWRRQQHATDEQEAELVSNASDNCPRENFIYRIIKFKTKQKRPQFIDKFWEQQDMHYTKLPNRNGTEGLSDIQLQNLDVHNLLSNAIFAKESALNYCLTEAQYAAASSRASSSLDLEWEHEYAHMRQLYQPPPHTHRSTQSLLNGGTLNSNNNLAQYTNSNNTPTHLHTLNNNHHTPSMSKRSHTYDNHQLHVHLNDSWQYLSNDDEQLSSLASYSQTQSLPHAPLNAAAMALATAKAVERGEQRMRMRRVAQPPINERRNSSFTRTSSSHNSWSHISTPESLEWDQDEEQQRQLRVEDDNLDDETLELLHQIEQLKNRVLDETGDGLYDNGLIAAIESEAGEGEGIQFMIGEQHSEEDGRKDIS